MSIPLVINGVTYTYPTTGEINWGTQATDWAEGVTQALNNLNTDGDIPLTSFSISNNISSPTNVLGLAFDPGEIRGAIVEYSVYRVTTGTGATEAAECGNLNLAYKSTAGTWEISRFSTGDAGLDFSVNSSGQILYTSSNFTGSSHSGVMKFRARVLTQ